MVGDCEVERALTLVQHASLRAVLTSPGRGRPSSLSVEAFVVGLLLAAADGHITTARVVRILTTEITAEAQQLLGLLRNVPPLTVDALTSMRAIRTA